MSLDRVAEICPAGWQHEWEAATDLYELTNPSGGYALIDGRSLYDPDMDPATLGLLRATLEGASHLTGLLMVEAERRHGEPMIFRVIQAEDAP